MPSKRRRIAVFPGQFDPITNGHLDIIRRGAELFEELIVAVGVNPEKRELFSLDERVEMIRGLVKDMRQVKVQKYTGLTVDFVKRAKALILVRGIRDVSDLRHEFQMAQVNRAVGHIETVFMMTGERYALISSSLIRQILAMGGDVRALSGVLPALVIDRLAECGKEELK
ncbi:MAG: pantetheine-phosphate adenylyltransferase [Tepidisphaeraceae bacterium]|jgi:pantetheine-phosphate adenylyltransferase